MEDNKILHFPHILLPQQKGFSINKTAFQLEELDTEFLCGGVLEKPNIKEGEKIRAIEEFKASATCSYSTHYTQSVLTRMAINLHNEGLFTSVAITQCSMYGFQKKLQGMTKGKKKYNLKRESNNQK